MTATPHHRTVSTRFSISTWAGIVGTLFGMTVVIVTALLNVRDKALNADRKGDENRVALTDIRREMSEDRAAMQAAFVKLADAVGSIERTLSRIEGELGAERRMREQRP